MPKYRYFQEIHLEEHCLRAAEIAGVFGFFTTKETPHKAFVSALLQSYNVPIYYYESGKGLLKGYCFKDYFPLLNKLILEAFEENEEVCVKKAILNNGSKKYTVVLTNAKRECLRNEETAKAYLNSVFKDSLIE